MSGRLSKHQRMSTILTVVALSAPSGLTAGCSGSCKWSYEDGDSPSTGSARPPPLPNAVDISPEQALKVYEHFRDACLRNDAKALWDLLDDGTQQDSEDRAKSIREVGAELGDKLARKTVPEYTGSLEAFTGFQYHIIDMTRPDGLCDDAENWTVDPRGIFGSEFLFVVGRRGGGGMGVFLSKDTDRRIRVRPTRWVKPQR